MASWYRYVYIMPNLTRNERIISLLFVIKNDLYDKSVCDKKIEFRHTFAAHQG
jgi:hypothetical protein